MASLGVLSAFRVKLLSEVHNSFGVILSIQFSSIAPVRLHLTYSIESS